MASPVVEETDSRKGSLWQRASFVAKNTVAFSQSFRTLRDMVTEFYVDPECLKFIKRLGEGKIGTNGRLFRAWNASQVLSQQLVCRHMRKGQSQ